MSLNPSDDEWRGNTTRTNTCPKFPALRQRQKFCVYPTIDFKLRKAKREGHVARHWTFQGDNYAILVGQTAVKQVVTAVQADELIASVAQPVA